MMKDDKDDIELSTAELENQLFQEAMKHVRPLKTREKTPLFQRKKFITSASPTSYVFEEKKSSQFIPFNEELLLKQISPLSPHSTLYFTRHGIHPRTLRQLKRGQLNIEFRMDLHGHTQKEAFIYLQKALPLAQQKKQRVGLIIHGKGKGETSILKSYLDVFLRECPCILAFATACPHHGGTGALYILLKMVRYSE